MSRRYTNGQTVVVDGIRGGALRIVRDNYVGTGLIDTGIC